MEICKTGNYTVTEGQSLGENHKVYDILGQGGFGCVSKCININTGNFEAVKVFKGQKDSTYYAQKEIDILEELQCLDPDGCNIVAWNGYFHHEEIICLKFELLDWSLWDYIIDSDCKGLPMTDIKHIIHELTTALDYMRTIDIIHADIKPMDVMVVDRHQRPLKIKLIDFGQAHLSCDAMPGVCVQTTWYTAPEVMLHSPYDKAIDMWSLGLLAAELAIGRPLYTGHTDYDVLRSITQVQGRLPDPVLDQGLGTHLYFNKETFGWSLKTPAQFKSETDYSPRKRRFQPMCLDDLCKFMPKNKTNKKFRHLLLDLIKRMLHLDPTERIKPWEALQHPFMTTSLIDSGWLKNNIRNHNKGAEIHQQASSHQNSPCVDGTASSTENTEDTQHGSMVEDNS